jgi:hypothetical protein
MSDSVAKIVEKALSVNLSTLQIKRKSAPMDVKSIGALRATNRTRERSRNELGRRNESVAGEGRTSDRLERVRDERAVGVLANVDAAGLIVAGVAPVARVVARAAVAGPVDPELARRVTHLERRGLVPVGTCDPGHGMTRAGHRITEHRVETGPDSLNRVDRPRRIHGPVAVEILRVRGGRRLDLAGVEALTVGRRIVVAVALRRGEPIAVEVVARDERGRLRDDLQLTTADAVRLNDDLGRRLRSDAVRRIIVERRPDRSAGLHRVRIAQLVGPVRAVRLGGAVGGIPHAVELEGAALEDVRRDEDLRVVRGERRRTPRGTAGAVRDLVTLHGDRVVAAGLRDDDDLELADVADGIAPTASATALVTTAFAATGTAGAVLDARRTLRRDQRVARQIFEAVELVVGEVLVADVVLAELRDERLTEPALEPLRHTPRVARGLTRAAFAARSAVAAGTGRRVAAVATRVRGASTIPTRVRRGASAVAVRRPIVVVRISVVIVITGSRGSDVRRTARAVCLPEHAFRRIRATDHRNHQTHQIQLSNVHQILQL